MSFALLLLGLVVAAGVGAGLDSGPSRDSASDGALMSGTEHERRPDVATAPAASRKPPRILVPNVVGEQQNVARAELAAHGLHARFIWHSGPSLICAGPAPQAEILGQSPDAAERMRRGAGVWLSVSDYLQTGCDRRVSSRDCDPSELSLRVVGGMPEYTGGGEDQLVNVLLKHVHGGSPCTVASRIRLDIDQPPGELASRIRGNPTTLRMHVTLDAGERMVAGWVLGNWCGSRNDVVARASLEGLTASKSLTRLPYGGGDCPTLGLYSLYEDDRTR